MKFLKGGSLQPSMVTLYNKNIVCGFRGTTKWVFGRMSCKPITNLYVSVLYEAISHCIGSLPMSVPIRKRVPAFAPGPRNSSQCCAGQLLQGWPQRSMKKRASDAVAACRSGQATLSRIPWPCAQLKFLAILRVLGMDPLVLGWEFVVVQAWRVTIRAF